MSLRERLEAKARRHLDVPILVDNPEPIQQRISAGHAALLMLPESAPPEDREALQAEVSAAEAELAEAVVTVGFDALLPRDLEALLVAHSTGEGGEVNREALLPVLAAECASDPELRDEQWWVEQLASGYWSKGELDELYRTLLVVLNYSVPRGRLGKG